MLSRLDRAFLPRSKCLLISWQQAPSAVIFSSVQFSHSIVSDSATPWAAAGQASLSITNSWSLLKIMSFEAVMPPNTVILCRPLLLPLSIFPSVRVSSNESLLHIRWPKYWSFSFNIIPSNEYSGLISFRMDWLDLLLVQGTLKSLLQRFTYGGVYMLMIPFQLVPLFFSCCIHVWSLYLCKYSRNRYVWNFKNGIDELIYWAGI